MKLSENQLETVIERASAALSEYCIDSQIHAVVTGVSGGLDSAVTIALAQRAQQKTIKSGHELKNIGLILPCHSDPQHAVLGKKVVQRFEADLLEVDLTSVFDAAHDAVLRPLSDRLVDLVGGQAEDRYRTAQGNIKARMRMTFGTYYVANMVNGMVLSTDNFSELMMGFWTLHGDVGDFGMIQNLWKGTELIQIAKALDVPAEVISAAPTDGLGVLPGGDEAQLGAKYEEIDEILKDLMMAGIDLDGSLEQLKTLPQIGHDEELVYKTAKRALGNAFKRRNPVNLSREDLGL